MIRLSATLVLAIAAYLVGCTQIPASPAGSSIRSQSAAASGFATNQLTSSILSARDLRARAGELLPDIARTLAYLDVAIQSSEVARITAAATDVFEITRPETGAIGDLEAEPCIADAAAAYGLALFYANVAASESIEWANGARDGYLNLAQQSIRDAIDAGGEFQRLDALASC